MVGLPGGKRLVRLEVGVHRGVDGNPEQRQCDEIPQTMARLEGLEPPTRGLEGRCSIHLSYRRVALNTVAGRGVVGVLAGEDSAESQGADWGAGPA